MYVSGEGSGKERRQKAEEQRRQAEAQNGQNNTPQTGKKHTICARKFAKQQVKDVIFAGAAALAMTAYMVSIGAPHAISGMALGIMAFAGKKVINAACRFGKKHIIKKREKGNGKIKKGLILTAAGILPVLVTGIPITGIVSAAIAASIMIKKAKHSKDKLDEKVGIVDAGDKNKGGKSK